MIDLALDPSETRRAPEAIQHRAAGRPWARIALFGALGVAGTGAFAGAANSYLSGLAGPQRAPLIVVSQKAAEWPDLKDGLPALATGSVPAVPKVREILPPEPAAPPVVEARIEPILRAGSSTGAEAVAPPAMDGRSADTAPTSMAKPSAAAAKPLPAIVNVPVIGPTRQAILVAPSRTVAGLAPLAAETVRARTGNATYAALPPENPGAVTTHPAAGRDETSKSETSKSEAQRAKPRIEAHSRSPAGAKPPQEAKPVAEKPAARKPAAVEANAVPAEARAQDEETEVFGIKVPSLAPAGRKLRESVEALGDAVKGIPDRF